MYQRGDRVLVGDGVLVVWEDRGRGLCLSSEAGYKRALAGDEDAPLVGYPSHDVRGLAEATSVPSERQPLVSQSPSAPQE